MKKIMIALAAVAMAACAQAASLNWMITATPGCDGDTSASGYAVYLFLTAAGGDYGADVVTQAQILTALESASSFDAFTDKAAAAKTLNAAGAITGATGFNGNNFAGGDSLSAIAVIVNAADAADATHYMITAEKSVAWASATGSQQLSYGPQASNTWQAIPEPTSGLLLLIGVAGLALKRKRA